MMVPDAIAKSGWRPLVGRVMFSGMNQRSIVSAFDQLSRTEQAELLDELRQKFDEDRGDHLSAEEAAILDKRMADYRREPSSAFDAESVCDEMVRFAREG
ncbi:MAG: putative addiction module component (TIGR02574 family) [Bradymonadia bacterium]|jgi:putative addiction module component (TIGR02574 family)